MDGTNISELVNATGNATISINSQGALLASSALFLMAVLPIYFGSWLSTKGKDQSMLEVISSYDAMIFPLIASTALFGMFLLFKYIPQEYINILVNLHFSIIGISSMASLLCPLMRNCTPASIKTYLFKMDLSSSEQAIEGTDGEEWKTTKKFSLEMQNRDIPGLILAIALGAIEYIRLNKFINGCFLLGGLFFYDIFWVFGTPVMVTVAKTLDAPIKVTFPRDLLEHGIFGRQLALLGLGDIVIPGIFIAMLLRFDLSLNRNGSRVYFYTGYFAYIVGLLCTFFVMHTFKAAQPALLYLVPTCLGFPLGLALIKGDFKEMFKYEDVPEQESIKPTSEDSVQKKID